MKLKRFIIDITESEDGKFKAEIIGSSNPDIMRYQDFEHVKKDYVPIQEVNKEWKAVEKKFKEEGKEIEGRLVKFGYKHYLMKDLLKAISDSVFLLTEKTEEEIRKEAERLNNLKH